MIQIDDVIISDEIRKKYFVCDLSKCKGACCVEGDAGAPLDEDELEILDKIYPKVKNYLSKKAQAWIEKYGTAVRDDDSTWVTPLVNGGACAFTVYDKGIALCGIEKAYREGKITWKKPISCELYPIRVREMKKVEMTALNYHKWEICKPACETGKAMKVPIYKFVKNGLIRRFGKKFYSKLDEVFNALDAEEEKK